MRRFFKARWRSVLAAAVPALVLVSSSIVVAPPEAASTVTSGTPPTGAVPTATPQAGTPAATDYLVTVYVTGTVPYGNRPTFSTRISPTPPAGAFSGSVTCTQVRINGTPVTIPGGLGLTAGSYTIAPTSCSGLTLTSNDGTFTYLGGTYNIVPDTTFVQPTNPVIATANTTHPTVTLSASVKERSNTVATVPGQRLTFEFETTNDSVIPGCYGTTITNGNGKALATCTLTPTDSLEFVKGTGLWFATYAGTTDYKGASTTVVSLGATTPTQAAINAFETFRRLETTPQYQITVVPTTKPPGCQPRQLTLTTTTSLLGVSLKALTCKTFHVLQIVDGVLLGTSFVLGAGSSAIVDVIQDVQVALLEQSAQATLAKLATQVVVAAPDYI